GYSLKGSAENIHPKALNDIIEQIKGDPQEQVVNTVVLRAMSKAKYSEEPAGHFGLGFKYYSHFTSPIRRYPDLLIHRIIKEYINGRWDDRTEKFYMNFVPEAAKNSSEREVAAEKMERDAEKLKMAEYISAYIGEEFDGIISGVLSSGFFVEIGNLIEGFVRVSTLMDDYYVLEKNSYRFIGERTKRKFALGDKVRVVVAEADPEKREVNFEIVR
ncbi:MAG: RNB domain-containing ribonuclease, partial [Clostridiales bacterium]|nr:RNB domain-containing ribonuclease [Clostridiales bacterium]